MFCKKKESMKEWNGSFPKSKRDESEAILCRRRQKIIFSEISSIQ
jgi:hypothetical protein